MTRPRHRQASLALASCLLAACEAGPLTDAGMPRDAPFEPAPDAPVADANVPTRLLVEQCFVPLSSSRADYAERLRGLWLAENVANWTGLLTEAERRRAPLRARREQDRGGDRSRARAP